MSYSTARPDAASLDSAVLGAANLAEVIGKLVDADIAVVRVRELLAAAGALTVRSGPPEVLTADRAWAELDLPIRVRLLR